jgi:hypothetical protein
MDRTTGTSDPPRGLFVTGRGFILPAAIWALYFAAVYAVQGAGCAVAFEAAGAAGFGPLWGILLALTLVAAAGIAATAVWSYLTWRRLRPAPDRDVAYERSEFLSMGALLNALLFLVATIWIGLPVLLFDPCRGHTVAW